MPVPELHINLSRFQVSIIVIIHAPDRVLVNDYDKAILTNTTGDILFHQKHLCGGPHTH